MEAYIVYLNPVAWKYPFRYDYDKSLSQVGDKIVQNKKNSTTGTRSNPKTKTR